MNDTRIVLSQRQAFELTQADHRLVDLLLDCAKAWPEPTMEVSCIGRTEDEEVAALAKTRVHSDGPPWRACDVRVRTLGPTDEYTLEDQAQADMVCSRLNAAWSYDSARPHLQVAFGLMHGSGPHLHLQIHAASGKTGLVTV